MNMYSLVLLLHQIFQIVSGKEILYHVESLEDCGIYCNLQNHHCNTFWFLPNHKQCHLIQIDCKVMYVSGHRYRVWMRKNMVESGRYFANPTVATRYLFVNGDLVFEAGTW